MHTVSKAVVAVACLAIGAACASAPPATSTKSASFSDAEIAAIVVAANAVDADMGTLAAERAVRTDVQQFGRTMTTDHRAVNQAAGELVARLKVTPAENAMSQKLRTDGTAVRAELAAKSGLAFDRAYIAPRGRIPQGSHRSRR